MDDIKCPKCGALCSADEEVCPSCGFNLKQQANRIDSNNNEPKWIQEYRRSGKRSGLFLIIVALAFVVAFAVFLTLLIVDIHSKTKWLILTPICGVLGILFLLLGLMQDRSSIHIIKIDEYYAVIYNVSSYWSLIIENVEMDSCLVGKYDVYYETKLTGNLPNNKALVVHIDHSNNHAISYETVDESEKEN